MKLALIGGPKLEPHLALPSQTTDGRSARAFEMPLTAGAWAGGKHSNEEPEVIQFAS